RDLARSRGPARVPVPHGARKSRARRLQVPQTGREGARPHGQGLRHVSAATRAQEPERRHPVRGRATDARAWARDHVRTAPHLSRRALARACAERSVGLAPMVVQDIFRTIKAINAAGTSVLLVEQNARYALETASRGYVLQTGSIIASGPCATLRNDDRVRQAYLGRSAAERMR